MIERDNNLSRTRFEQLYKRESDAGVKERMLLVLNVVYDKRVPAQVARDIHRSRTWASDCLKRYKKEGIEGLKDKSKSGRPPDIPEEIVYEIKSQLSSSKEGWTTKQVNDIIVRESGYNIIRFTSTHYFENGDSTESTKKSTCKYCIKRREGTF